MRIVHINNIANVAWYLAQAQRSLGHEVTVVVRKDAVWPGDVILRTRGDPVSWNWEVLRHWRVFRTAHVVHIHGGIWLSQVAYGLLRRLFPATAFLVHLHGTETRTGRGLHHLDWADAFVCSTPDLRRFGPAIQWIPNPFPLPREAAPSGRLGKVIIGHFPSRRTMKGTERVIEGFYEFASGGGVAKVENAGHTKLVSAEAELWIVEGVSHERALDLMRRCDIVIDQVMPYDSYGMVSVEGMSLGKVVVSSYSPEYYEELPLIRAGPDDRLSGILRDLFERREEWRQIGVASREYVKETHSDLDVAGRFLNLYYDLLSRPSWDRERARRYWVGRGRGYLDEFLSGPKLQEFERKRGQAKGLETVLKSLDYRDFIEVGCGFGRITQLLKERPGAVGCGIDLSIDQLRSAEAFLGTREVSLVQGDAAHLSFRNESADLVLASEVLMHLPPEDFREALAEMVRISRRYVVNIDWYESYAVGAIGTNAWIHDYPSVYAALGLPVMTFSPHERTLQLIFVADKHLGKPRPGPSHDLTQK